LVRDDRQIFIACMGDAKDFTDLIQKPYKEQSQFFLNAYWNEHGASDAELVWQNTQKFQELDLQKGKEGNELDEFNSHRFLEFFKETQTIIGLRELLSAAGIDRKKRMSLIEYLLCKYKHTIHELIAKPQVTQKGAPAGPPSEDFIKAQQALAAVNNEIQKIEKKKSELETAAAGSGVKAMQAKNELSQLLNQDNTDLNRALLTAEAAVRKAGGSGPLGSVWWMGRELEELKKYKPQAKGGKK